MEPAAFGLFLKEMRTERRMTQAQLAQCLHVLVAAVSKWERGKCLPDIAKLEALARALDLTVLEVIECRRQENAGAGQEQAAVYTETLKLARRQERRRLRQIAVTAACVAAALVCLHFFPVYRMAYVWPSGYYRTDEVSLLAYIGSREERAIARQVLAQVKAENPDFRFLELWSARFGETDGFIWVYYSRENRDEEGRLRSGSWNVPALWYMRRSDDGAWWVHAVREQP